MHEITCPHCGKAFQVDEAGYADILKQVRDREFDQAVHERLELAETEKRTAVELAEATLTNRLQEGAARKDTEIERLRGELKSSEIAKELAPILRRHTVATTYLQQPIITLVLRRRGHQHHRLLEIPDPRGGLACRLPVRRTHQPHR